MNINTIREFYRSPLGKVTQRLLRVHIRHIWPDLKGMRLLGVGYALPYMAHYLPDAERVCMMVPPFSGAHNWPDKQKNLVALAHEDELPIENNSIDRVLMVHSLEAVDHIEETLEEIWRVLESNGRLLLIVPNRTGFWSRGDHTPFGQGVPFSLRQLQSLLHAASFTIERVEHGLFMPPFQTKICLSMSPALERFGSRFLTAVGGVHILEVSKQLFAGIHVEKNTPQMRRKRLAIPEMTS